MIKIAVCQYKIEKLSSWDAYVKKITALVIQAKKNGAQLLLLPEYAGIEIAGYHPSDKALYAALQPLIPAYCKLFQELATTHKIYIQAGTIIVATSPGNYVNRAYFFGADGTMGYQDKLQLIEFEKNQQILQQGQSQTLFETAFGKIGIAVCYDAEFPELVRRLTLAGAWLILVPSYTISMAGYHRVMLSCRARALENQCYVAATFIVGEVAVTEQNENTIGQAAILGPVEDSFSDNGIIAEGKMNDIAMVCAELFPEKLTWVRKNGQVHLFEDVKRWNEMPKQELQLIKL